MVLTAKSKIALECGPRSGGAKFAPQGRSCCHNVQDKGVGVGQVTLMRRVQREGWRCTEAAIILVRDLHAAGEYAMKLHTQTLTDMFLKTDRMR